MTAATDPPLRTELDALLRRTPLLVELGIQVVDWAPGSALVRLASAAGHINMTGSVHGGVLFALADAAFEVPCNGYGRVCVALETACHYTAPAPGGSVLLAAADEVARTRRTASYRIDVTTDDGTRLAWYMALAYRTSRWHFGEDAWPPTWRAAH